MNFESKLDKYIIDDILKQDGFKLIRDYAIRITKENSPNDCFEIAKYLYNDEDYRMQELSVFVLGYISYYVNDAFIFLKNEVSLNGDWRIQEILAMAFDSFCNKNGYKESLKIIKEWLECDNQNVRRAVTEGLRIWTSRPYFKENPNVAIKILSDLKSDNSEYVRKSVGNSLKDISKKYPDLIKNEVAIWNLDTKEINQVYKLATEKLK